MKPPLTSTVKARGEFHFWRRDSKSECPHEDRFVSLRALPPHLLVRPSPLAKLAPSNPSGCPRSLRSVRTLLRKAPRKKPAFAGYFLGVPTGIRTPVLTVKGWCPNRARRWGLTAEPGTLRRESRRARAKFSRSSLRAPVPTTSFRSPPISAAHSPLFGYATMRSLDFPAPPHFT